MTEFLEVFQTRRSVRKFKSQEISKEVIVEILDLCRNAANAHNAQPFRFIIILNKTTKTQLIKSMASQYEQDLKRDGLPASSIQKLVNNSINTFLNAPVLILACLTMDEMHKYPDPERQHCEFLMGVQSVATSLQNLLLIAHSKGLGGCWYCAPLFCPNIIKSFLHLPESYIPQAFLTLGIPAEKPAPRPQKPLKELIQFVE
jgi:coenzyme F420-0:L-glutamate ligase/coenzyme F420-1:gamma-L-glutamate ligase